MEQRSFLTNESGTTGYLHATNKQTKTTPNQNKQKLDMGLMPFTKMKSEIIDLNVKCKTLKLLGDNLDDLDYGNDFLDTKLKAQSVKEKLLS